MSEIGILDQRLQGPEPEDLVQDLVDELLSLVQVERQRLLREQASNDLLDLEDDRVPVQLFDVREVQTLQ
jgi:hypothetical protein